MPEYLILIWEDEEQWANASPEVEGEIMQGHMKFGDNNKDVLRGGNALLPSATSTSIRADGDSFSVTDGPFAETKEGLGGYYVVEADDLDAAIAIAKQVPARFGGVEVRPIRVFD